MSKTLTKTCPQCFGCMEEAFTRRIEDDHHDIVIQAMAFMGQIKFPVTVRLWVCKTEGCKHREAEKL